MSAAMWSQLLAGATMVALIAALVVSRPVVAWLAAGLALAGGLASASFGPTALLLAWSAAASIAAATAVVGRRGALVVALVAAAGASLPAGSVSATAPGVLALLPALAVLGAVPAMTGALSRVMRGGPGLLLAAVGLLWLPVGLDAGPWPLQIVQHQTLPATLAAAQHLVSETGVVLAQRPPLLGLLGTAWPIWATALVAAHLVALRRAPDQSRYLRAGPLLLVASALLLAGLSVANSWSAPDLVWTPAAAWLVRAVVVGWLLFQAAERSHPLGQAGLQLGTVPLQPGPVRLLSGLRWLALATVLTGVTAAALWLPLWLGPLWWRDPLAAAWLGLAIATLTRTLHGQDDVVAALADALAFASATAVVGGSAAGAAVAGALS